MILKLPVIFGRGDRVRLPSSHSVAEPLYTTDTHEFFIGNGEGNALTKVPTASGVLTQNKQVTFDANGNLVASTFSVGDISTALHSGNGTDTAWGGWIGDSSLPLSWQLYSGSNASPISGGTPVFRMASVVSGDLASGSPTSAAVHQIKTTIRNPATGNWTGFSHLLYDYNPGTGDHVGIQSRVVSAADRSGAGGSGGDMWGFYAFIDNNNHHTNAIGMEINVHNSDSVGKSYIDDQPDGAGPNSAGRMMTGLQVNGDGATYNATRGISIGPAGASVGFDTGLSITGHANVGIYINSPNTLAYRDPGVNSIPASKTDIKWGNSTSAIGIDFSAHTFTGPAIKLSPDHTFSDGTVVKTLAQLATPPTNITGNASTASSLSAVSELPNGTTATTQSAGDNSTKVATTAYVNSAVSVAGGGNVTGPASSIAGHVAVFSGTDGKAIADGGLAGLGTITGVTAGTGLSGGGTSGEVTLNLSSMPAGTLKGNNTGGVAAPIDLTAAQVMSMLGAQPALSSTNALEIGDGTGTIVHDWRTSAGVDFNARISKSGGLNSQFTFNNRGDSGLETGSIVFDSTNSVLTGNCQTKGNLTVGSIDNAQAHLHVIGEDNTPSAFIDSYNNTTNPSIICRRAGGSVSNPTQVKVDYTLSNFATRPWFSDTAAWSTAEYASITIKAAEDIDSIHHGTYMQFLTTAKGIGSGTGNSNTLRMQIYDDGGVRVGGDFSTSPGNGSLAVGGNLSAVGSVLSSNSMGIYNSSGDAYLQMGSGLVDKTAKYGYSYSGNFTYIQGGTWGGLTNHVVLQGGGGGVAIGSTSDPGNGNLSVSGTVNSAGVNIVASGTGAGFTIKNSAASFTNVFSAGGVGNPILVANWTIAGAQSDATKPSWGIVQQINNDKMLFQRAPAGGSLGTLVAVWASGGMTLNPTSSSHVDPGAGNFTISGTVSSASLTASTESATDNLVQVDQIGDTGAPTITCRKARGTKSAKTQVTADTSLFELGGKPWISDSAAWSNTSYASISGYSAEAVDSTHHGAYLVFKTTPTGNASPLERMRIHASGGVSLGNTTDPTAGCLYVSGNVTSDGVIKGTQFQDVVSTSSGTSFTINLSSGMDQELTTTGNATITLPAPVAGKSYTITVKYGGVHTITWAGGGTLKWSGGMAPTATSVAGKYDIYVFKSDATGTITFGADGGRNY